MKKKMENNDIFSGHKRRCQSTARMPTDWDADRSCQFQLRKVITGQQGVLKNIDTFKNENDLKIEDIIINQSNQRNWNDLKIKDYARGQMKVFNP